MIFEISVNERKFSKIFLKRPCKIRNTYTGAQNVLLGGETTELLECPKMSFLVNCNCSIYTQMNKKRIYISL